MCIKIYSTAVPINNMHTVYTETLINESESRFRWNSTYIISISVHFHTWLRMKKSWFMPWLKYIAHTIWISKTDLYWCMKTEKKKHKEKDWSKKVRVDMECVRKYMVAYIILWYEMSHIGVCHKHGESDRCFLTYTLH